MPKVFKLQQLGNVIQQILNAVSGKAEQNDLNAHTGNGDVHVSTGEKNRWNDTYTKTEVDNRIEQGGKVKTVSVNGGSAVQPDEHGNIDIEVPTDLKDLNDDSMHRTVTDDEKSAWSGKQPAGDYATRTELANGLATKQPTGDYATRTEVALGLATKQDSGDYATRTELSEGLAGKQGTISDLEAIRSGAGKGATSVQGVKMEGDNNPLTPGEDGVVTIPQPEIPDSVTSVITNNELVFQTPDGESVKGKVGIAMGADSLLHLTLTDEEGHVYSSPIAGLRVVGNALQYSNDGETWTTVQTFGRLAIKYVQASDPASGDEGDLALVGTTNAYVLKVYVGGSWVSVCDFGTLDLTSDGITMVGENKTLTDVLYKKEDGEEETTTTVNYSTSGILALPDYAIGSDGKAYAVSGKSVTKYIAIAGGSSYICKSKAFGNNANVGLAFYTEENEESYIDGSFSRVLDTAQTAPATAKYIRITWPNAGQSQNSTNQLTYHKPTIIYKDKIEALENAVAALEENKADTADVEELVEGLIQEAREEEEEYVTEIDLTDRACLARVNTIAAVDSVSGVLNAISVNPTWAGIAIPCEEGDAFLVSADRRDQNDYPVAFIDKDNKTLQRWSSSTAYSNTRFTAPQGAKMLLVNGHYHVLSVKKVFAQKTKLSETGVDFIDYATPIRYDSSGNTRNGAITKAGGSTGDVTSSEGDTNKVKTDNIWLPKNSRITFHVEGENITLVSFDYSINGSYNIYTFSTSGTYSLRMGADGVLAFVFAKSDSSALAPSELTSWVQIERPAEESVADFNTDKDALIFAATRHPTNSHSVEISGTTAAQPCFCVVTDVHDSWKQLWRAMDYADSHPYILGTLFLGDFTAGLGYKNGTQYAQPVLDMIMQHNKPLLRVSGNHDSGITRAMYMETWFPDRVVAKTGETHKEGCPWWYIDFPYTYKWKPSDNDPASTSNKTLRIIGNFDNDSGASAVSGYFGTSDEQYQWICDKLAECDANTHVMILRHYSTINVTEETLVGDWRPKSRFWSPSGDDTANQGKLCAIIDAWMKGEAYTSGTISKDFSEGGVSHADKFVCYLTGHWHKDYVLKHPTLPQIDIAQTCTAVENGGSNKYSRCDIPSSASGKNQDSFNVVAVDMYRRAVNLVRIGSDVTTDLRERKMISIELPSLSE